MFKRSGNTPTTRLQAGQTRVVHASHGMHLKVVAGRLWVTQPNCPEDIFLCAGQMLALDQDWIVIQADQPAQSGNCEFELGPVRTHWLSPMRYLRTSLP